ncbi:MAG: hypothetical protein JNK64_19745 [Myxococcales bacterium]|nr:hypothetical protein [Myxococcales bacterium]
MTRTTTTSTIMILCAALAAGGACKGKKADDKSGGTTSAKAGTKGGAAPSYAALTADPEPAAITPADTAPFESVKFRQLATRDKSGWPTYDAYNLGTKAIKYIAITGYAYDKDGKQVARSSPPLSWNGDIAPGAKTDWAIKLDDWGEKPIPASAVTFQVCFDSIKRDGDADSITEMSRCPQDRPLVK